jgi:hypothetical protein
MGFQEYCEAKISNYLRLVQGKKSFPYIFVKIFLMNESKAALVNWILFLLSALGIILMLVYVREFFWMALPFVVTTFARALKIM